MAEVRLRAEHFVKSPDYIIFEKPKGVFKALNCKTQAIEFKDVDASAVIQSAMDALTPNRAWQERVLLKGDFTLKSTIRLPSHTILDFRQARLFASGFDVLITNKDWVAGNEKITVIGGVVESDRVGNPNVAFKRVRDLSLIDLHLKKVCEAFDSIIPSLCDNVRILTPKLEDCGKTDGGSIGLRGSTNVLILNPYIYNSRADGIWVGWEDLDVPAPVYSKNVSILGGHIEYCGRSGIRIDVETMHTKVMGLEIKNCGRLYTPVAERTGITCYGLDVLVQGVRAYDDQPTKTQTYGFLVDAVAGYTVPIGIVVKDCDFRENLTGLAIIGINVWDTVFENILGMIQDTQKGYLAPSIGVNDVYGDVAGFKSPLGRFRWLRVKITWGGTFAAGETVTVKTEIVYHDETKRSIEKSATATGEAWLTEDDLHFLWEHGKRVVGINTYAKTNLATTAVTVTVDYYGLS